MVRKEDHNKNTKGHREIGIQWTNNDLKMQMHGDTWIG